MASSVNKVILLGNLGRDPEVKRMESGVPVATFSLATSESYTDKATGEKKEITDWHNIVLWRGLAEISEKYLRKGNKVLVQGKLRTRSWNDKDGNQRYTTEILADDLVLLTPKADGSNPMDVHVSTNPYPVEMNQPLTNIDIQGNDEDDLPF